MSTQMTARMVAMVTWIATTGAASIATGQEAATSSTPAGACPAGYPSEVVCITPDPTHCLSAQALDAHEQDLAECQSARDRLQGRIDALSAQIEASDLQIDRLTRRASRREQRARTWRTVAIVVGGVAVVSTGVWVGDVAGWWRVAYP